MSSRRLPSLLLTVATLAVAYCSTSCVSSVVDVYVSPDADGLRVLKPEGGQPLVVFPPATPAVYCVAEISNGREDATIEALMHQQSVTDPANGGATDASRDIIVASLSERAPVGAQQKIVLALTGKNEKGEDDANVPLSSGQYLCEFALRSQPTPPGQKPVWDGIAQFRIDGAACPPARIFSGQPCVLYGEGAQCPKDGSRSEKQSTSPVCQCGGGAWACQ